MDTYQFLQIIHVKEKSFEYAKKLYLDRLAPGFSPFQFVDLDEMRISAILAWLLNPQGSHGQGGRFLQLFLQKLSADWPPNACEQAEVKTECWIDEGRVDIHIKSGSRCCIIENKPWAGDQPDQLARYLNQLDLLKAHDGRLTPNAYPLVYLTADGSPPTKHSLSEKQQEDRVKTGQLHYWAFCGHLLDWITQCKILCRADRVTIFIDEFGRYIRSQFGGAEDVTLQDQLVGEIMTSPTMVTSAMQVVLAGDAIREKLLSKLKIEIAATVVSEGWTLDWNVSSSRLTGFNIDFSKQSECMFRIDFYKSQYNSVAYGAYKKNHATSEDGGVRAALLAAKLNSDSRSPGDRHWAWWRSLSLHDELLPFEEDWGRSAQPWAAIAEGKMANAIIEAVRCFRNALASAGE